jgi:membrane associated rhomboid family serine protease
VKLKVAYNAPVVLTFALAAIIVQMLPASLHTWFQAYPDASYGEAHLWVGMFTHPLGHASWDHQLANFMLILLIGPILEERHGSLRLLAMMLVTALVTGLATMLFSHHYLVGASGIAFMMILLSSTANIKAGKIPLTFIAVAILYMGAEITKIANDDQVSHMAHLVGGSVGAVFGFLFAPRPKKAKLAAATATAKNGPPVAELGVPTATALPASK